MGEGTFDSVPESTLVTQIKHAANVMQYLYQHNRMSLFADTGFPDLTLCKPGRAVIYVETKVESKTKGKLRKGRMNKAGTRYLMGQDEWLDALKQCPGAVPLLVRPSTLQVLLEFMADETVDISALQNWHDA